MNLIIVESPTKAKTISQFLGKQYKVLSSYGHVRDLPKSRLGIDVEHDFEPHYITPKKNKANVALLKKEAVKAKRLILATDEDREGEAIAWHLEQLLTGKADAKKRDKPVTAPIDRIVFHEITKSAIEDALSHPRKIDVHMVDAQQARRILDRLVGYTLSPFLWKKVLRGLSAGRVQSVALRLIADREEEIKTFVPEEYWTITAHFKTKKSEFEAGLIKMNGATLEKLGIKNREEAEKIVHDLAKAKFIVEDSEEKLTQKNPAGPFTTSTLQQEAAKRLGFSSKKTMFLSQGLYENGHITYMRTDSMNMSEDSLRAAAAWIKENLPKEYMLSAPQKFKGKSRLAQEAHEAIRPTTPSYEPTAFTGEKDVKRLYELIWRRFIASQLPPAEFLATRAEIGATGTSDTPYLFSANGITLRFDGFLKIWQTKFEEKELPLLKKEESLTAKELVPEEHHTEHPPRYNEASLIKTLEKYGVGRPSTYAPTISVIQSRGYVGKEQGRFVPSEIGMTVNTLLKKHFPEIVDIEFTAKMEEGLDEIAEGKADWRTPLREFYVPFAARVKEKYDSVEKLELVTETTDEICDKCGKPMIVKLGRFGKFLACSGFPDCKNAKTLKDPTKLIGMKCPKCLEDTARKENPGDVIEKRVSRGRARGKIFWGCNRYPACDYASWTNPLEPPKEKDGEEKKPKKSE